MSKIFVSYRHVSPDQEFAHHIAQVLREHAREVFPNIGMLLGTGWGTRSNRRLPARNSLVERRGLQVPVLWEVRIPTRASGAWEIRGLGQCEGDE